MRLSAIPRFGNLYRVCELTAIIESAGFTTIPSRRSPSEVGRVDFEVHGSEVLVAKNLAETHGFSLLYS